MVGQAGGAREPLTLKVEYDDAGQLVADYAENISRGETFVHTARGLEPGTAVRLLLSFPGLLVPIDVAGEVRWAGPDENNVPGVAVAFAPASPEVAHQLDALVQRIAEGDPALVARTMRILLAEDNPHVATLIRDGLCGGVKRQLGGRLAFHFVTAPDGRAALDALTAEPPFDVIITDIYLPIMDGAQLIRRVRATPGICDVPVVAMSAGGPTAQQAAIDAGANYFLDKPLRLANLLAMIRQLAM